MGSKPTRLERITNLFLALLDTPRPLSLREIGTAVAGYPAEPAALRQAFERDKRTLREEGLPIAVERVDGEEQVGYRILPEEYYLPDLGLSEEEREALAFALAAVRLEGGVGRGALEKLSPGSMPDLPPVAVLPALPALAELQEAIRSRRVVEFTYHGRRRQLEGHGLVFRLGAWYVVGADRSACGERRTFRVDRIEGGLSSGPGGAYERPEREVPGDLLLAPWAAPDRPRLPGGAEEGAPAPSDEPDASAPVAVTVEVDVRELSYARALLGERSMLERRPDGSARFGVLVADEDAFLAWVVGRGDAVEVVDPPTLRRRVVEALEQLATETADRR